MKLSEYIEGDHPPDFRIEQDIIDGRVYAGVFCSSDCSFDYYGRPLIEDINIEDMPGVWEEQRSAELERCEIGMIVDGSISIDVTGCDGSIDSYGIALDGDVQFCGDMDRKYKLDFLKGLEFEDVGFILE